MSESYIPPSAEVNSYEQQVYELFDEAVAIGKTINSWPNHDVPNEGLYQFLKKRLYSIASELGFDINNPDSLRDFHIMIWDYWHKGEFNYPISSPTEYDSPSDQESISAEEVSTLLNNALLTLNTLDFNDNAQIKRFIEDLEFIAVLLGFDIKNKKSMDDFIQLLDVMIGQAQKDSQQSRSDFDLAA